MIFITGGAGFIGSNLVAALAERDRPVIVCWGYEKEAAAGLLPAALPQPPLPGPAAHRAVLEAHQSFHNLELMRRDESGDLRYMSLSGEPVLRSDRGGAAVRRRGNDAR